MKAHTYPNIAECNSELRALFLRAEVQTWVICGSESLFSHLDSENQSVGTEGPKV